MRAVPIFMPSSSTVSAIRRAYLVPPAELAPYVERLWSWECDGPGPLPLLLPGTGAELVLHYRCPFLVLGADGARSLLPPAHLCCLRSYSSPLSASGPVGFVAVRFRSSAVRHFGGLPMAGLIDRFAPAVEHFGPEVVGLPERLASLPGLGERAAVVFDFLLAALRTWQGQVGLEDRLVDALYYGDPAQSVAAMAEATGYSARQLERIVGATTGLSPKRFRRVARLHHTVRYLLLEGRSDYLDAALARGFYDQAHFIHELKALAGRAPREVFSREGLMSHFYNPRLRVRGRIGASYCHA